MEPFGEAGVQRHFYPFKEKIKTKSRVNIADFIVRASIIIVTALIVLINMYKVANNIYWGIAIIFVYFIFGFILISTEPKILYDDAVIDTSIYYYTDDHLEVHRENIREYKEYSLRNEVDNEIKIYGNNEWQFFGPIQVTDVIYYMRYSDIHSIEFNKADETVIVHADMKKLTYECGNLCEREINKEKLKDFSLKIKVYGKYNGKDHTLRKDTYQRGPL